MQLQSLSSLYLSKEKPKREREVANSAVLAGRRMGFFTINVPWLLRVHQRSGNFHANHLNNEYHAVPSGLQCTEFEFSELIPEYCASMTAAEFSELNT